MSVRKIFEDKALEVGVAFDDDAHELAQFFKTISDGAPADQRDDMFNQLKVAFTPDNLAKFIAENDQHLSLYAAVEGRIVGAMFARYVSQEEHMRAKWEDPNQHLNLLWYGVASEARGAVYSKPHYSVSGALFTFLRFYADNDYDCKNIETLTHVSNTHAKMTLLNNGFTNMGNMQLNLHSDTNAVSSPLARNYERFRLRLSPRVLN